MTDRQDRNLDWREELRRIQAELHSLPSAAQLAVAAVVAEFLEEDAEPGERRVEIRRAA